MRNIKKERLTGSEARDLRHQRLRVSDSAILDHLRDCSRPKKISCYITPYHHRKLESYRRRYGLSTASMIEAILDLLPYPRDFKGRVK